jgi:hypothetical protein
VAIVIDSSSPAAHTTTAQANSTAAFTPPDDSMLLACWAGDSPSSGAPSTPSAVSSPSQTWNADVWDRRASGSPAVDGQAAIWDAELVGTSPGSTVLTVTNGQPTSSFGSILKVYVLTGHDPAGPIGQAGGGRSTQASSLSASYTAGITGGQGFMIFSDWAAGDPTPWTAMSGCTIEDRGTISGEISYAVVRRTDPDGVQGVVTTMGMTGLNLGSNAWHWAYAEVISLEAAIAAAAAAGYPAFGANAPMF